MRDDTPVQLLRYAVYDPMGLVKDPCTGKLSKQEYREIGYNGCALERADIVLYREGTVGNWKHVCLAYDDTPPSSGLLRTIDGNQGRNASIQIRSRDLDAKVQGGDPSLVFVHAGLSSGFFF
ncbi:hypothetical protein [Beijerinckia mobilis]|uniref:hypothetical protein n=1 Tax=Beijerinckia mobilis TaxID=231434 RepID=UPI00054DE46C|nr:hypothetical protein [Beijerinckia mobilis]